MNIIERIETVIANLDLILANKDMIIGEVLKNDENMIIVEVPGLQCFGNDVGEFGIHCGLCTNANLWLLEDITLDHKVFENIDSSYYTDPDGFTTYNDELMHKLAAGFMTENGLIDRNTYYPTKRSRDVTPCTVNPIRHWDEYNVNYWLIEKRWDYVVYCHKTLTVILESVRAGDYAK